MSSQPSVPFKQKCFGSLVKWKTVPQRKAEFMEEGGQMSTAQLASTGPHCGGGMGVRPARAC